MPRISKIRLTGCKYDGFRKEHQDSIFDLTKEGTPDHTLFTLCNGGGKGVMMQLMFQLLLPATRWGKSDGNKIQSMFYDQRNNLIPYTFHVVLEWVLDTVPEKRLITGIAMKAIVKNTSSEEEERTGLSYYLYTHEHDGRGYFTVENLPLYDKSKGQPVDLDVFEGFLNDNRMDFIKYSRSSVRRKDGEYYRYLESRGIHRAEWLNLKTMNKSEGGVGDYFIGASDNKSVFDKVILPAISENLRNYTIDDGDSLIQMFKSNLSITKDLPVLIKREGDYKELLVEIEPLIQNSSSGSRFIDLKDRLLDEGNDIYYILKDEYKIIVESINKWSKEEEKARLEKKELEFQKDNLNYNMARRDLELKEREGESLDLSIQEKNQAIKEKEEELITYEINEVLNAKRETEANISKKIREREILVEALNIVDIRDRIDELDDEIYTEWDRVKKAWTGNENQYIGYLNYTRGLREENQNKINKYRNKKEKLQNQINIFHLKEEDLVKERHKLGEYYDPMTLIFPERILEGLVKDKEGIEKTKDSLIDQKQAFNDMLVEVNNDLNRLRYSLDDKEEKKSSLEEDIKKKEREELDLAKKLCSQLLKDYDGSLLNHLWFENKLEEVENLKTRKEQDLEDLLRAIWEKNINKSLNKEDYFIPNKDIALIKNEIKAIGLHVETGAEYLQAVSRSERKNILNNHPGFLYSLVIGSRMDWDLIDKNINKEIFLNNLVPIYIRSEMKEVEPSFKLILAKAYGLVEEEEYLKWKDNLDREYKDLIEVEASIRSDIHKIDELKNHLSVILSKDTAFILSKRLRDLEKEILDLSDKLRGLEEEKLDIENKLYMVNKEIDKNLASLAELNTSIDQIKGYIGKVEEIEGERGRIEDIEGQVKDINTEISNLEENIQAIRYDEDGIREAYGKWQLKISAILGDLKSIYQDLDYRPVVDNNYTNYKVPDFSLGDHSLQVLLKERKALEEDISSRNNEIALIDRDLEYLNKDLLKHLDDLKRIHREWTKYPVLETSTSEINISINRCKIGLDNLKEESRKIRSVLDRILGSIGELKKGLENMERQIRKDHKRPAIVLQVEDLLKEINTVERNLESNRDYLSLCLEEIEKNNRLKNKLEINLIRIRDSYGLDSTKGKMNKILKEKVKNNIDALVDNWISRFVKNENEIKLSVDEGERFRSNFIRKINHRLEEDRLKDQILSAVKEANIGNFKNNLISFTSMKTHFQQEVLNLSKDKKKAENAMKQWTDRASIYVIRMVEALKDMVNSMNYTNDQGYVFPLVKLKGMERLPKEESDVSYLLEEYFVQAISQILEKNQDIDKIEDRAFNDLMGDRVIFSKALQGRYPTLLVYKMTEKNEFKYARARDEYYTTWEAINKGEGDLPEGSGGQTLSVNTFVIMMIMSFKKKHIGNENPSTVLILDNPFGKASAKHVLDPIFEIANKLNFQLITFAAPEIIKMEISERFPVFWELKIEDGKIVHGGRIIKENS